MRTESILAASFSLLTLLLATSATFRVCATNKIIHVPGDFETIQAAVDAADDGDEVVVGGGTYIENILIRKQITIRSESGVGKCIIEPMLLYSSVVPTVNISSNHVEINGFTIEGNRYGIGISINNVGGCRIANNVISGFYCGVLLLRSSNNEVVDNTFVGNDFGMSLEGANDNVISNNAFIRGGVHVLDSYNNLIRGNHINGKSLVYLERVSNLLVNEAGQVVAVNCRGITIRGLNLSDIAVGIEFQGTEDSTVERNIIENSSFGIELITSSDIRLANNLLRNNTWGVFLVETKNIEVIDNVVVGNIFGISISGLIESSSNKIINNTVKGNLCGISISLSSDNVVTNNTVKENSEGISLILTGGNKIYLNDIIDNNCSVYSDAQTNQWHSEKRMNYKYSGRIFNNYLGNHWSGYNGSDADLDGVGDTPHKVGKEVDEYPLMQPHSRYTPLYGKSCLVELFSEMGKVSGAGQYEAGSTVVVQISPAVVPKDLFTDYVFRGWIAENGTIVSKSPTYSFTVMEPLSLTASWEVQPSSIGTLVSVGIVASVAVASVMVFLFSKKRGTDRT
jgi:parallel beta-helix repeat protein